MKALIIDDIAHMRDNLQVLLSQIAPEIQVVGMADGVKTGLAAILEHDPDLIFLDVEMNDGTGFDLLNLIPEPRFKVILVTGHEGYAIRAFRISAIDYLLKPIDPDDLIHALEKAKEQLPITQVQISTAQDQKNREKIQQLLLADADSIYLVQVDDIIRCQAEDNYTRFYLTDGRVLLISKTLKEYSDLLETQSFFRSHQSHLVNLHFFDHLDKRSGGYIVLKDGGQIPLAVRKKESLIQRLKSAH